MKKKIVIILLITIVLIFPIKQIYKDGGTKTYTSLTYKIIFWNKLDDSLDSGYRTGTDFYLFPNNFKALDDYYEMEETIEFKDDFEQDTILNATYKFFGKSEHFVFNTGKVYYSDIDRQILITNFKMLKSIKNLSKITINVYFNNMLWGYSNSVKGDRLSYNFNEYLKEVALAENGKVCDDSGACESDVFIETTADTFKDSIKIEIEYCLKDGCKIELMELFYVE